MNAIRNFFGRLAFWKDDDDSPQVETLEELDKKQNQALIIMGIIVLFLLNRGGK